MPDPALKRAAQYVRVSTDHQRYSTANQADAIAVYAALKGFVVVATYADEGRSGLDLAGRHSLRRLLSDVLSGAPDFEAILVYDVSRWGRFQDADESAAYEFMCRSAGVPVHYCAEQFDNDGSMSATILKNLKRVMAHEYSRELGAKVWAGHRRLTTMGYRMGGPAGYGLRRCLIDADGKFKRLLDRGQYKALHEDRVILVPGPQFEIDTVNRIYRMYVFEKMQETAIANCLNNEGVVTDTGGRWYKARIRQVLTNEKYLGHNIYNRRSMKLKAIGVDNPRDSWIRADNAFVGIVDAKLFWAAQRMRRSHAETLTDAELLAMLSKLLEAHGRLTAKEIDQSRDTPSASYYIHRFGSIRNAYQKIGYTAVRDGRHIEDRPRLKALYPYLVAKILSQIEADGGNVACDETGLATIDNAVTLTIAISRCFFRHAKPHWDLIHNRILNSDLVIVALMDEQNEAVEAYYAIPQHEFGGYARLRVRRTQRVSLERYRVADLGTLRAVIQNYENGNAATDAHRRQHSS